MRRLFVASYLFEFMDYEYNDDADDAELAHFAQVIEEHHFTDQDIQKIFTDLINSNENSIQVAELDVELRINEIEHTRITRYCKTENSQIFRIHFPNSYSFILKMNTEFSYDAQIKTMEAVAELGVPIAKTYKINSDGITLNNKTYFAVLQEFIEGHNFESAATKGNLSPRDSELILQDMGENLRKIHSIRDIDSFAGSNAETFYADAINQLDLERTKILEEGICTQEEFESVYAKAESLVSVSKIFGPDSFGLTHFNFYPQNIIISSDHTPKIAAVLDWTDANLSNIYFDFALWDYWCGEEFLIDSLMESYGVEFFNSSEAKVNVELTTIAALINELCEYASSPELKATQLGLWQRLKHEVIQATY